MRKKYYRFYGGLLTAQERWLNRMAEKGFRLVRSEKMLYEFEECEPGAYQYRIEFVGHKSAQNAADYTSFLKDCGYCVFFKNINLNYSVGKVRWRPWAEKGGQFATNKTTFNRELLIIEKTNDGKPFELHTSYEDQASYYITLRNPWLCLFLLLAGLGIVYRSLLFGCLALASLVPVIIYQVQASKANKNAKIKEW